MVRAKMGSPILWFVIVSGDVMFVFGLGFVWGAIDGLGR